MKESAFLKMVAPNFVSGKSLLLLGRNGGEGRDASEVVPVLAAAPPQTEMKMSRAVSVSAAARLLVCSLS